MASLMVGCSTTQINSKLARVDTDKLDAISKLSYGIALNSTNTPAVKTLNDKIQSLAGIPNVSEINSIKDNLNRSNYSWLDTSINSTQLKEDRINNQILEAANKAGELQTELNKYHAWFGIEAIILGIKELIKTALWFILGGSILFLVLRILAGVNPIAGIIFSVFESIGSVLIHTISGLAPKALTAVQSLETSALNKLVDAVQFCESIGKADIAAIKNELSRTLTDKEKAIIAQIKKDLNY